MMNKISMQFLLRLAGRIYQPLLMLIMSSFLASTALAQSAASASPSSSFSLPSLFERSKILGLTEPVGFLALPKDAQISPNALLGSPADYSFKPWSLGTRLPTSTTHNVWLKLTLPPTDPPQTWILRIPRITLDKATLYSPSAQQPQNWLSGSAGLSLPRKVWPLNSRDPAFAVTTLPGQTQLFFVELEHRQPITENIQLIHHSDFADGANYVGTMYGLILGIFMILSLGSVISAWIHRSTHFGWLALFCFSIMLSQLTVSGYMNVRIWPNSVFMANIAGWLFPLLSLAALARLALSVSYAKDLSKTIYYSLWVVVLASLVFAGVVMSIPLEASRNFLNPFYALGMLVILGSLVWIAWRSQHWLWMVVASILPVMLSVMARLAYNLGWVAHVELALLMGVITSGLGLLIVFTVLYLHQRERFSAQQRQLALENRDASTGLYNERIIMARFPQILLRSKRFDRPCGAIMVRWLDFERVMAGASSTERGRIFSHLGSRLSRQSRDIDTVARLGDDLFLYLIEAPVSREDINALASQILSSCLRPSAVMPDTKGFDLHLAVWLSNESQADATQALELLKTRIAHMRSGTQRRVQFVDTDVNSGRESEKDQALTAAQLVAKINSLEATQGLPTINLKSRAILK